MFKTLNLSVGNLWVDPRMIKERLLKFFTKSVFIPNFQAAHCLIKKEVVASCQNYCNMLLIDANVQYITIYKTFDSNLHLVLWI